MFPPCITVVSQEMLTPVGWNVANPSRCRSSVAGIINMTINSEAVDQLDPWLSELPPGGVLCVDAMIVYDRQTIVGFVFSLFLSNKDLGYIILLRLSFLEKFFSVMG